MEIGEHYIATSFVGQKRSLGQFAERLRMDPDMEAVMIDATIIRAHACAAGYEKGSQKEQALGRSIGGFTSKINAMVDSTTFL